MLSTQLQIAKSELQKEKHLCTADQRLLLKQNKDYIVDKEGVNYRRFEYYLYQKVSRMLDSNHIFVNESAKNKRLEDDLIPITEWKKNEYLVANTGLDKLIAPIKQTLATLTKSVRHKMAQVSRNINDGANDFVIHQPRTNQLTWKLANKRWKDDLDNPIYNQLQHMGIIEIMDYVNQRTGTPLISTGLINKGLSAHIGLFAEMGTNPLITTQRRVRWLGVGQTPIPT